jgi:type IV pilus assembly protein PilA
MLKSLKKKMKDQAGLTLIELLVVIVILGIIAAVAIPMVMSNKDDAAKSTNAQNLSVLQDAVNRYRTLNDIYPASLDNLLLAPDSGAHKGGPFLDTKPAVTTFGTTCPSGTDWAYSNGKVTLVTACYK